MTTATQGKGPRDQFIVRPSLSVGALVRRDAAASGRSFSDVLAEIVSAHYGQPVHNDVADIRPQEPLPMTG